MLKKIFLLIIILCLVIVNTIYAIDRSPHNPTPDKEAPQKSKITPEKVFDDVEEGWQSETVELITKHISDNHKVYVSFEKDGPKPGYYSKDQVYYLFKDIFKNTITEKFEFTKYDISASEPYAVAERHYKLNADGVLNKDKIYVSLIKDSKCWVLNKIRSLRK